MKLVLERVLGKVKDDGYALQVPRLVEPPEPPDPVSTAVKLSGSDKPYYRWVGPDGDVVPRFHPRRRQNVEIRQETARAGARGRLTRAILGPLRTFTPSSRCCSCSPHSGHCTMSAAFPYAG